MLKTFLCDLKNKMKTLSVKNVDPSSISQFFHLFIYLIVVFILCTQGYFTYTMSPGIMAGGDCRVSVFGVVKIESPEQIINN